MKKIIRVKFIDFWDGFNPNDCIFMEVLQKRYDVHLCNEWESCDYVIHSVFGNKNVYEDKAIKIFYSGEAQEPDFNISDYAVSYCGCTYGDRSFYLRNHYFNDTYKKRTLAAEKKHMGFSDYDSLKKTEFCSFVVSNALGNEKRKKMFEALNHYKRVNSGGRYLNNIGSPIDDKIQFESRHKFSICFENCSYPGYTTEKIIEAFAAKTIPIYWGDPNICRIINRNSFINVMDYSSIEEVVERIIEIDNDNSLYIKMLKQPIWVNEEENYYNTYNRFAEWLYNIIDQPMSQARRTPTGYWHDGMIWKKKEYIYAYNHPYKHILKKLL